jgi:hypothetical protein
MSHRRSQKALEYLLELGVITVLEELIGILLLN